MGRILKQSELCQPACGEEGICQKNDNTGEFQCFCPSNSYYAQQGKTCDDEDEELPDISSEDIPVIPKSFIPSFNTSDNHVFERERILQVVKDGTEISKVSINTTEGIEVLASTPKISMAVIVTVSVTLSVIMILLTIISIILWRKNKCRFLLFGKSGDSILDKSSALLKAAANPNYYACPEISGLRNLKEREIPKENLIFLEEIGQGCFGKVFKGELKHEEEVTKVAIKVLKEGVTGEAQSDFEREVEILSTFDHENIVRLLGVVLKEMGESPWMVFEYMELGDLAELLRSHGSSISSTSETTFSPFSKMDLIWISAQIANGMVYLVSQHYVHRDLAARNCLVGSDLAVKISDFGMSRDIYTCDYYKIGGSRLLPVRWMAPESVMYGKFTMETDVWSYGIVLWEIFTHGKQPYYGHSNEEVVKLILQGILPQLPEDCPFVISELMAKCWKTDPKDRINFPKISAVLREHVKNAHPQPSSPESPTNSTEYDSDPLHTTL